MDRNKKGLNVEIGKRLREVRDNLGYTQFQFAEILGVGEEHYRKIELGASGLTVQKIRRLYDHLNIDATYLIAGEKKEGSDIDYFLTNCTNVERREIMHRMFEYMERILNKE